MKVLHLSESPLSSSPYRLMQVQKDLGYDARLILHKNSYTDNSQIIHPYDIILQDGKSNKEKRQEGPCFSRDEIFQLFEEANVIHVHNFIKDHFVFRLFPHLKEHLKNKHVVFQVHSPRRSLKNISKDIKNPNVNRKLVVAQYQADQFPECEVFPNVVPIHDPCHCPRDNWPEVGDIPRICYSPSNTKLKGWNNKGHDIVKKAMAMVEGEHIFDEIIETPFLQCLERKRKSDICIDEVVTGSYHMSSLEAMSQGVATINAINEGCEKTLEKWTGIRAHPMLKADAQTLASRINILLKSPELLAKVKYQSRLFMENYWNTEKIGEKLRDIYEI